MEAEMRALIEELNRASDAYYNTDSPVMSDKEWDEKFDRLQAMEEETGIALSASPTQNAGYAVLEGLVKEAHEVPALSLDKTKDVGELEAFAGMQDTVLSWKMDGLTVVLTYENGRLTKGLTRGDGAVGEVITDNVKNFQNVPLTIPDTGKLIVRGEAVITYADFARINASLPEGKKPYENPRNLCSGSVRQLDPNETRRRNVRFVAFSTTKEGLGTRSAQLAHLKRCGFEVVEHEVVEAGAPVADAVHAFQGRIQENAFPSDGLVLQFDDIAYGESLGATGRFRRDSIAFKWQDETAETTLREILWSPSRTGLINPVAIFDPVRLEGTTVSRASVHNVSVLEKLSLTPGDTVTVYKANMIIPQIEENLTKHKAAEIPHTCPACGAKAEIRTIGGDARTLWCPNPACSAKHLGLFEHAVRRDALDIRGISKETLQRFMDAGLLATLPDLFKLQGRKDEIIALDGFGEQSYLKIIGSVNAARTTTLDRLIYALGIKNVGRTASKAICRQFEWDPVRVVNATKEELLAISGIGEEIADAFTEWFKNQCNLEIFEGLMTEAAFATHPGESRESGPGHTLDGMTIVITGSLNHFDNRSELKEMLESEGAKVSGSVSSKTDCLINNDITSTSGKNKKAKELGVRIVTEDEFLTELGFTSYLDK